MQEFSRYPHTRWFPDDKYLGQHEEFDLYLRKEGKAEMVIARSAADKWGFYEDSVSYIERNQNIMKESSNDYCRAFAAAFLLLRDPSISPNSSPVPATSC